MKAGPRPAVSAAVVSPSRWARPGVGGARQQAHTSFEHAEALLALDDLLLPTLIQNGNAADTLGKLSDRLGRPVGLYSPGGRLLAGQPVMPGSVSVGQHSRLNASARKSIGAGEPVILSSSGDQFTVLGLVAGREHIGTVAVPGSDSQVSVLLGRGSLFLTVALLVERILLDVESRPTATFVEQLLNGEQENRSPGIAKRLAQHGIRERGEVEVLAVFAGEQGVLGNCLNHVRKATEHARTIVSLHEDHVCVLAGAGHGDLGHVVASALRHAGIPVIVGCAVRTGNVFTALPEAHGEASAVGRAAGSLGFGAGAYDNTDLGVAGLLMNGADPTLVDRLIERFIGPILDYDQSHGTELAETAFQYFENARHLAQTAAALYVHISTVKKRLARIDEIQGPQWRMGTTAIDTHFTLRLWQLRHRDQAQPSRN